MNNQTCGKCKFFVPAADTLEGVKWGTCHRYPKHVVTAADDWCGEYKLGEVTGFVTVDLEADSEKG